MIWIPYYFIMYLVVAGIHISTLWNDKSKHWVSGRKGWLEKLDLFPEKSSPRIWFHVSSLGEFEQARPVIQRLKEQKPEREIILTFYSPSGYMLRSDYDLASVMYLPSDLPGVAKKWVTRIKPDVAIFVKYDLWPGYLNALKQNKIPTFLISAHWIPGKMFSSWALPPTKSLLKNFKKIFLQEGNHLAYFLKKGFTNLSVAGDTRIDRSLELPSEIKTRMPDVLVGAPSFDLIAGSTWPQDEKIISKVIQQMNLSIMIAPHEVSASNIQRVLKSLPVYTKKLSELRSGEPLPKVILIDSVGLLSVLYSLGKIAYIGGGFGSGIHNILEPMAHQKPILFGPAFAKFPEAVAMVDLEAAWSVTDASTLRNKITFLLDSGNAEKAGKIAHHYLQTHGDATSIVTNSILESIPYGIKS
jgi:3-deoxy-D-manno-octulosonic-acid transferase